MLPYRDSRLVKILLGLFFLLLVGYAYYQGQAALFGPTLSVPESPIVTEEHLIVIRGKAEHISELKINNAPVAVTEEGTFEEPVALSPGLNRFIIDAADKYGRVRQEVIEVVFRDSTPSENPVRSTSTDPDATDLSRDRP